MLMLRQSLSRIALALIACLWASLAFGQALAPYPTSYVTASATGTTGATTATLPALQGQTLYLLGFSINSTATAAAAGNATVTGTISGTLNFEMGTGVSPAVVVTQETFGTWGIPASAVNQAIAVVSAAPGAGGVISVTAWGYYRQQ
jgi:hypothetical protein